MPTVVLLRVVEPISPPEIVPDRMAIDSYRNAKEKTEAPAKNYLSEMAERLKAEGIAVETDITEGMPANGILSYAEEKGVDLIVMSTHGRSGVSRWFFGSVANVVRTSQILRRLV